MVREERGKNEWRYGVGESEATYVTGCAIQGSMRSDPTNMYNISWMNENEKAEYVRRDQAEWVANEALTAAWLRGDFDDEIKYLIPLYTIHRTNNSLANMTRQLQAIEYAEDLCAKAQDRSIEDSIDFHQVREDIWHTGPRLFLQVVLLISRRVREKT